ncbi:MAG: molybdopterin cofactor-binding domain-containing protein, partial [Pseudomonadota bacterium]
MTTLQLTKQVLEINGKPRQLTAHPGQRLSDVLREQLGLVGTKVGCDAGDCGACTILIDGVPKCACLTPLSHVTGCKVMTIEGLSEDQLAPVQEAFLRHGAAQCGICTPGMLMAATALLAQNPSPSPEEAEEALSGVLCRCTGYRKIIDAVCDVGNRMEARDFAEMDTIVGASVQRLDGRQKVDGSELFGADFWPVDALYARAVRSPYHAATFRFGDLAKFVEATPGVETVLTVDDIKGENTFGVITPFADQPALASGLTRFRGEAVALIVGERETLTTMRHDEFPITWTETEAVLDPVAALAPSTLLHEDRANNVLVTGKVQTGNAEAALTGATHVVRGEIATSFVEHAYIEPEAGCAWLDGDVLVIQACTQAPYMDRDDTARVLGLAPERIRIIPAATGGGFGSKIDVSLQPLLGLVALRTGKPCRMVYTRSESMTSTTKRHPGNLRAT